MKKFTILSFAVMSFVVSLATACSSGSNTATTNTNTTTNNNQTTATKTNTNAATNTAHSADEEIPASVKAAFADAQSFTKQHKDIPQNTIAEIEKDTGGRVPEKDHHSYLAFATTGGKRTQIGAATVVKAGGKDVLIIYENKGGAPTIKEVRSEGVPAAFLAQFAGKGHDDKLEIGGDVKINGADEGAAKAIAQAVRIDSTTMQTLYGAAHSH